LPATKKTETTTKEVTSNDALKTNMRFYSQFMTTPKEAQRPFNNGSFSGTDINPMFRIQKLTEVFGPVGFGWWTGNVRYEFVESPETKEVSVFCELDLYVKDPESGEVSQPIYGIGGNTYIKNWAKSGLKASDEAKKMAYTDAVSIACKSLGIGHDIWYSQDRTKYTMYDQSATEKKPEAKAETKAEAPAHTADTATVIADIEDLLSDIGKNMTQEQKRNLAETKIKPIIGVMNYKTCTDVEKLMKLRDALKELKAA